MNTACNDVGIRDEALVLDAADDDDFEADMMIVALALLVALYW